MRKRIGSLFLALVLCLNLLPTAALAEGAEQEMQGSAGVGDTIDNNTAVQDTGEDNSEVQTEHAVHPICNDSGCTESAHQLPEGKTWTGVSALSNDMAAGYYYLLGDITLDSAWNPADGVVLCLNGHSITMRKEGAVINIPSSSSFTLTDCKEQYGKITHTAGVKGSGVNMNASGAKFVMYGGDICGNESIRNGGGIWASSNAAITMYGGEISGNTAAQNGGGVFLNNGTFTMHGGMIGGAGENPGNKAVNGGGVYLAGGTFKMDGGSNQTPDVYGNYASGNGGGVYMGGDQSTRFQMANGVQVINNNPSSDVYLEGGKSIEIVGGLTGEKTVGVTLERMPAEGKYVVFANAANGYTLTDSDAKMFFANDDYNKTYNSVRSDNVLRMVNGELHQHKIGINSGYATGDATFDALTYDADTKQLKYAENVSPIDTSGSYQIYNSTLYLKNDITLDAPIKIMGNVTLCLNGHSIIIAADRDAIEINEGCSLTLCDCRGRGTEYGKITHAEGNTGRGVTLNADSTLAMYGGSITGNTLSENEAKGAGVYVPSTANFNMRGGEITGNTITGQSGEGGGVWTSGTALVTGNARIAENKVSGNSGKGGGAYVTGELTLGGNAEIKENTVKSYGGGIYLSNNAGLSVSGCVQVTDNKDGYFPYQGGSNVFFGGNSSEKIKAITVTEALNAAARIGVTVQSQRISANGLPVTIASATGNWIGKDNFISDYDLYKITVSEDGTVANLMEHDHTWGYRAKSEDSIEEYCTAKDCHAVGGTLTLETDGESVWLSSVGWHGSATANDISYAIKNSSGGYDAITGTPVKRGDYRASITVGGVTAQAEFTVEGYVPNSSDFMFRPPMDLPYNGQPKTAEVTTSKSGMGSITVKYYDENGREVVAPIDAGTYEVRIDVTGGDTFKGASGLTDSSWKFTITQAQQQLRYAEAEVTKTYGEAAFVNALTEGKVDGTVTYTSSAPAVAAVDAAGKVTIAGAGTAIITASAAATKNYAETTASYTLTVEQKPVSVSGITAADKIYDGTTAAAPDCSKAVLTGKMDGDALTVTASGAFADADVGENKSVLLSDLRLGGASAGNYRLTADSQTQTTAAITPAVITVTPDAGQSKPYGAAEPALTYTASGAVNRENPAFEGVLARIAGETVGSYAVQQGTLKLVDGKGFKAGNYELQFGKNTVDFTITQAVPVIIAAVSRQIMKNGVEVDISDWASFGNTDSDAKLLYALDGAPAGITLTNNRLKAASDTQTAAFTIKVSAAATANFAAPAEQAITVSVVNKADAGVRISGVPVEKTYGDADFTLTASAENTGDGAGVWTWTSSDEAVLQVTGSGSTATVKVRKASAAGAVITAKYESDTTIGTAAAAPVTVGRATITVTAKNQSIYVNGTVPDLSAPVKDTHYTVTGLAGGDTLAGTLTMKYRKDGAAVTPDTSKAGTYDIVITGAAEPAGGNYNPLILHAGTLTIANRSSGGGGGGGSAAYPVNTSGKPENGSVTVSPKNASKGSTVTITVKPDSGYRLEKLTVTDKDGHALKLTDKGNGQYAFTMSAGKVDVSAAFAKEIETSPFGDVSADDYYYEAVKWAQENGITGGIGNGLFGPKQVCTRAQIVTFLWRAAGSPKPKSMVSFTDVPADAYYAKAVAWAIENGIALGTADTTFSPNAVCTRAHGVTFLFRAAKASASGASAFTDVAADAYYAEAIRWAVENGITNGIGGSLFGPDSSCTRAQIVTFLWRMYADK